MGISAALMRINDDARACTLSDVLYASGNNPEKQAIIAPTTTHIAPEKKISLGAYKLTHKIPLSQKLPENRVSGRNTL